MEHENVDELLREFVIESNENLETIDRDLMVLERDPGAPDVPASVFCAMHTLKGIAGFFDLPNIERLARPRTCSASCATACSSRRRRASRRCCSKCGRSSPTS